MLASLAYTLIAVAGLLLVAALARAWSGRPAAAGPRRGPSSFTQASAAALQAAALTGGASVLFDRCEPPPPPPPSQPCAAGYAWIGPGWFMMGSEEGDSDERPVHRVDIGAGFCLGKRGVTNAEYGRCVSAGRCEAVEWDKCFMGAPSKADLEGPDHPVVCITVEQARRYAGYVGGRLPSESEWEYAARVGGRQEGESASSYEVRALGPRRYAWGDSLPGAEGPLRGNFADESLKAARPDWPVDILSGYEDGSVYTSKVGSYPEGRTPEGVLDLTGNVWEWVEDAWHPNYEGAPPNGSAWGQGSAADAVFRGGGWVSSPAGLRASGRGGRGGVVRDVSVGFRVVAPPPGPP